MSAKADNRFLEDSDFNPGHLGFRDKYLWDNKSRRRLGLSCGPFAFSGDAQCRA